MTDAAAVPDLRIPASLLPADGRFGSGPSKVRHEAVAALADAAPRLLGTSHRQTPVRSLVGRLRSGLRQLWDLPDGSEVLLGNGGTSVFWDAATASLIARRSSHAVFGEFSGRFAELVGRAPFLEAPVMAEAPPGSRVEPAVADGVDCYALTHNETSTGVAAPVGRPAGADPDALVLVDATSAAGVLAWDPTEVDAYYFAPQKAFAAEGGLWLAVLSEAARRRVEQLPRAGRWVPATLDLSVAAANSALDQTLNTPAISTLALTVHSLEWMLEQGGMDWTAARCADSAGRLYGWAEARPWAAPFVADPQLRSPVVGTVDLAVEVPALTVAAVLRANGVVDTEPYRRLGRNQLRIGLFPAVEPDDVDALTACIDWVVGAL